MLPYIFIFLFASVLYFHKNERKVSVGFYIFLMLLILISGFRDMIGGYDVYIYGQIFDAPVEVIANFKAFEPGFRLYYIFLKQLNDNRHFMFFITALLMMSLHFFAVKKHSPIVYFSIFLLFCKFFLMSFVYLRQGLAMGIIWFSFPYILNKNYIKFFLLAALAFCFHKSSVIFVPMLFVGGLKFKNINMFIIAFVALIIAVSPLSGILLGALAESSGDEKASIYVAKSGDVNIFYFIEILLLIWLLLQFRADFYKTKYGTLLANGLFGYIIVNIMALTNASFVRFGWYYFFFLILAIPSIYNFINSQKTKMAFKTIVFAYYSLLFFRLLIVYDGGDFMPYKSIFQDFNRGSMWEFMEYK